MALPFVPPPHDLSTDDVHPAELAERIFQRCNDTVDLLRAEHLGTGPNAGHHAAIIIPIAVAIVIPPHRRTPVQAHASQGLQAYGSPPVGFKTPPTWDWRGGYVVSSFELEDDLQLVSARCSVMHDKTAANLTAQNSESLAPRFMPQSSRVGAFHLGWADSYYWLHRFTIVVHGRRRA